MFLTSPLRPHLDELASQKWTLFSVDKAFCNDLKAAAKMRLQNKNFRQAQLAANHQVVLEIRNDQIYWLETTSDLLNDTEKYFLEKLDELKNEIRNDFRIYLDSVESHYAYYEKGHYYKRHRDTTTLNNKRIFSLVLYLNENWSEADGGELTAFENDKKLFSIQPQLGQMILFRSDLEHEVSPTNRDRFSIAAWLRQ